MEQYDPISSAASQSPHKGKRSDDSEKHLPDGNERERVIITHICATDVVAGLRRIPAGFYVAIEADGKITKTSNKPPMVGEDVVEWDEEFSLPSERSCAVSFKIYASFELGPRLGNGELLREVKITVGELLDRSEQLRLSGENKILPSCPSLKIIVERRMCCLDDSASIPELVEPDAMTELGELTDAGQRALARYRQHQHERDLDEAVTYLELVRDMCPPDHPSLSSILFNLATATFTRCQANPSDLDLPITLYQDALQLRPNGHPDHCMTALDLSVALLARFRRRGSEADRTEALDLLHKVLALSPAESYSYCVASLALEVVEAPSSIQTIEPRIPQPDNEESDDDEVIWRVRFALQHIPDGDSDPDRAGALAGLGILLRGRFDRTGDLDDIHESILMLEQAVGLTPDGDPNKPAQLNNLGHLLARRFEWVGDLADINKSISMFEQAVDLTLDGHSDKAGWLSNLGNSLFRRFERVGDLADINKSISMLEHAVDLAPDSHPFKPGALNNIGNSLLSRFERVGDLVDIHKSISIFEQAVDLTPDGHPFRPAGLNNLGNSLLRRFERVGDLADIHESISMAEQAVDLTPDGDPDKPARLTNLGTSLFRRFERVGDLMDINKSISMFKHAVDLTPDGHSLKPAVFNNLGNSLLSRFERVGDLADINKSISMFEQAVDLTPDGHTDKPVHLNNLGNSLSCRFERVGDLADIHKSISMFEQGVDLTPDGHPNKPNWLNNLGNSLFRRFERVGDLVDMNKSISMTEQAVDLTPDGHADKPARFNNLGNSLLLRFERLGDLGDIHKSILLFNQAVDLTLDGHPRKPMWLNSLGNSLSRRFERVGDLADINKSISMFEQAVDLTPDGHPRKPTWLNNLGTSLLSRYEWVGDLADINKSISMCEQAMDLTPDGHPFKPAQLNSFGSSLLSRFERVGELADLNKSLSMFEKAVDLTPDGHPEKPARFNNLGNSFFEQFQQSHNPSHLSAATTCFSAAARSLTGFTSTRFRASRRWISSASLAGDSETRRDAYDTSINILPQLAWLGLPLIERHRLLRDAADVVRDAAAFAVETGRPEQAVEWLEQGRSVVWNQFLQLRTPVDELRVEYPDLVDQFEQTSRELEQAGSRQNSTSQQFSGHSHPETLSLEKETQRHHELATMREKFLENIRALPGFDRFLLPKTIQQLAASVHSGPVVYLNASKQGCDALIVMRHLDHVLHVPLPGVTYDTVELLQEVLHDLLRRKQLIASRDDMSSHLPPEKTSMMEDLASMMVRDGMETAGADRAVRPPRTGGHTPDHLFRSILLVLWTGVVSPVLGALGFSTPPSCGEKKKKTRIFWCPTGLFAFLPIHAAGLHDSTEPGTKLSDFVISSYTPSLSALPLTPHITTSNTNVRLLAVPQPPTDGFHKLGCVTDEINHVRTLSAGSSFVTFQESCGTVEDVLAKMEASKSDWLHFACHGVQDSKNPLDSGLCLADRRRLKLSNIIQLSRPRGGLAFLSACQTAQGDENLSEESVHLAAGMLLAGYNGVIATMWSIMDDDAPKVAKDVYQYLFRDDKVPDSTEAAEALHYAVQHLRDSGASFFSWVPFIHVGL